MSLLYIFNSVFYSSPLPHSWKNGLRLLDPTCTSKLLCFMLKLKVMVVLMFFLININISFTAFFVTYCSRNLQHLLCEPLHLPTLTIIWNSPRIALTSHKDFHLNVVHSFDRSKILWPLEKLRLSLSLSDHNWKLFHLFFDSAFVSLLFAELTVVCFSDIAGGCSQCWVIAAVRPCDWML